jgi:hypothetical protein
MMVVWELSLKALQRLYASWVSTRCVSRSRMLLLVQDKMIIVQVAILIIVLLGSWAIVVGPESIPNCESQLVDPSVDYA